MAARAFGGRAKIAVLRPRVVCGGAAFTAPACRAPADTGARRSFSATSRMKRIPSIFLFVGMLAAGCDFASSPPPPASASPVEEIGAPVPGSSVTATSSHGARLAAIDAGTTAVPAETVARYDAAFDALAPECTEPPDRISDFAVTGVDMLREKGVRWTTFDFLVGMERAISPPLSPMSCAEVAAALVTLAAAPVP